MIDNGILFEELEAYQRYLADAVDHGPHAPASAEPQSPDTGLRRPEPGDGAEGHLLGSDRVRVLGDRFAIRIFEHRCVTGYRRLVILVGGLSVGSRAGNAYHDFLERFIRDELENLLLITQDEGPMRDSCRLRIRGRLR